MTTLNERQRWNIIRLLMVLSMSTCVFLFVALQNNKHKEIFSFNFSKPAFAQLKNHFNDVKRIRIYTPNGAFQIYHKNNDWVLHERSDYPISNLALEKFADFAFNLSKQDLITEDPSQFDTYGVGEPQEFGQGNVIEFFDAQDQKIMANHIGFVGNAIYIRAQGTRKVFSGIGDIIPFSNISYWINTDFFNFNPEDIGAAKILNPDGKIINIARNNEGAFANKFGQTGTKYTNAALGILYLNIIDVAPRINIQGTPSVIVQTILNNGNVIELKLIQKYKINWVTINAISADSAWSEKINNNAKNWAFAIDEKSAANMLIK